MIKYIRREWLFISLSGGLIFINLYIILFIIIGCSLKNIDEFMDSVNKIASFLLNEHIGRKCPSYNIPVHQHRRFNNSLIIHNLRIIQFKKLYQ